MENIVEEIKEITLEQEKKFKLDEEYIKLREFYEMVKSQGLLKPEKYNIPPIDTIGKRLMQNNSKSKNLDINQK